jgi:hypothetical protein
MKPFTEHKLTRPAGVPKADWRWLSQAMAHGRKGRFERAVPVRDDDRDFWVPASIAKRLT